ncbi:hypothetical protein DV736_g5265, partial [Chaetothyriales sp. CBS 134916]
MQATPGGVARVTNVPRITFPISHNGFEHPDQPVYGVGLTRSPDRTRSIVSFDGASADSIASCMAEFDPRALLSPALVTPVSSEVSSSFYDNPCIYDSEQYVRPAQPESPSWNIFGDGHYCSSPPQLAGIAQTTSYDDAARYVQSHVEFVSPEDPSPTPILRERYSRHTVSRCTNDHAWWYLDRPEFILKLDLDLPGSLLEVPVKEVDVVDPSYQELHAWKTNTQGEVPVMEKTSVWTPPLVLYLTDKVEGKRSIFNQLAICMNRVFAIKEDDPIIKPNQAHWPWPCFDSDDNDWEAHIVIAIFEYWRKDIPSHKVLGKAHTVLFFNYVLDHMWQVKGDGLTEMLVNLQNKQGYDPSKKVSPDTVNSFLKSLVFDWALECIRDILKELQDLLHTMALGRETSTAMSDLAFCLSFMTLVTLSQTQSRLLLLTTYNKREIGIDLPRAEADRLIVEMEREVATYIIHLHEFALKRRKIAAASPNSIDAAERHAASFGLMHKVQELTLRQFSAYPNPSLHKLGAEFSTVDQKPSRFKLPLRDIDRFDPVNTHRLCWKFVDTIIGNAQQK